MITIVLMIVGLLGLAKILIKHQQKLKVCKTNLTCCVIVAHKIFNCGIQIKSKYCLHTHDYTHTFYVSCDQDGFDVK